MTEITSNAFAFLIYCFIQGITPGPANTVSFAAGITAGKKSALRQWLGLVVGFIAVSVLSFFMLVMLGGIADEVIPLISWLGAAYIVYLAFHMLKTSGGAHVEEGDRRRPSFMTGLIVQLTNAKIAVACIAAFSSYVLPCTSDPLLMGVSVLAMPLIGTMCNLVWLLCGSLLTRFYLRHEKAINVLMAISLLLCAVSMVKIG